MNYDSERKANELPVLSFELPPAASSFFFFFLSALSLSSSDAKMAARVQPRCNIRVYLYPTMTTTRRIKVKNTTSGRGLGGRPFARYTLCNPCIKMITYAHIAVVSASQRQWRRHRKPPATSRISSTDRTR